MRLPAEVVVATGNPGKLREIERLLDGLGIDVVPQSAYRVDEAEETGTSFVENALIKARHAARVTGLAAIADDSGLVVEALDGRPGIRSARFAGNDADDDANIDKLLAELADVPDEARGAAFHCAAVFVTPGDAEAVIASGEWPGRILRERRGGGGFGYDPVFFDAELDRSAAELSPAEKNARSHRGKALRALVAKLRQQ